MKIDRTGIYHVDMFEVPSASRAEFEAAMARSQAFLSKLSGFRGQAVLDGPDGAVVTIAAWESREAIAEATKRVTAYYAEIGYDRAASAARLGITLRRAIVTPRGSEPIDPT